MKNTTKLISEIDLIIRIEKKLGRENLSQEEVKFMVDSANSGVPRQMFNYGVYLYLMNHDEEESRSWFNKTLKKMNGYGLLRCSGVLAGLGEEWIEDSVKFLKRAAWRQNPIAKRMIKMMKEHPFDFPKA